MIWEIDLTLPAEQRNESKRGLAPSAALEALKSREKFIVLTVRDGNIKDIAAEKVIDEILCEDYIGVNVRTLQTDNNRNKLNGIVFKHLSIFSTDVQKRLRERKQKIQYVLNQPNL